MSRKPLPGFGVKGRLGKHGRMVRAFLEDGKVRVTWREPGVGRRQESWRDTPEGREEAKAYAEGVYERLAAKRAPVAAPARLTILELWERYLMAERPALRGRTVLNYQRRFGKFLAFMKPETLADTVTREHLDEYRATLGEHGHAPNQVAAHLRIVKQVFAWGVDRDLIPPTKVASYRVKLGLDAKPLEIAEYTPAEWAKLLAQFDPRDRHGWRPYALATLLAYCGPRQTAARSLEWRDIDLMGRRIHWRPERDKVATERWQAMPAPVAEAFWVAYGWRIAEGYPGRYVFFGAQRRTRATPLARRPRRAKARETLEGVTVREKPWTYQAFHAALRAAEAAAGIPHLPYRGAHGFRRGVVTELYRRTKDLKLAADYVGDRDLRTVQRHYLKGRADDSARAADVLERVAGDVVQGASENATIMQPARQSGGPEGVGA